MKNLFLFFLFFVQTLTASNILPLPQKLEYNKEKALLGKKLFFETKLSKDNTISCASCHDLFNGGDDNLKVSVGIGGALGILNAPTVLNSVFNFAQFWDGRAKSLEEQALGPIENKVEMGHDFSKLIKDLKNSEYKQEFEKVYKSEISKENIVNAIAEFEKTLITPNSRFDRYLMGEKNILSSFEKEGFELFKNKGCIACHHGINIGGNHFNKFGAIVDVKNAHLGRYNVTKNKDDKYYFKVPSLRNVELTAPYFHDGRYFDLKEAVSNMALVQLGRPISDEEIEKIVAFLKTLTGKLKIIE